MIILSNFEIKCDGLIYNRVYLWIK